MLCFPTSSIYCFSITLWKRKPQRQCTGALCVQHSPTAAALSTSFLLNHAPKRPELKALTTRFIELQQRAYESWVNKIEQIKQQLVEFWQCTYTASEKCNFAIPFLPGSAAAQVIWSDIVKNLLIAYFVGSISAKTYQNLLTCVKIIASHRWDFFETRCILIYRTYARHNTQLHQGSRLGLNIR